MDVLTRKTKHRSGGDSDDDSDDGPPPDPDDPLPPPPAPKKDKKPTGDAKEVQVSVRKSGDDKSIQLFGGLTGMRRELLMSIRAEEDEQWQDYEYCDRRVSSKCSSVFQSC
jgi:DNA-directed RNA polymerase III subunit RPC5